jgi:hypothetical protein
VPWFIWGNPTIAVGTSNVTHTWEWRKDHPIIERVAIEPIQGGLALGWHTEF